MDNLAFAQEPDDVVDIRVVAEPENVVIRHARLLLCRHILDQICHRVAGDRHGCSRPRRAGGCLRIDARRMIDKIGGEALLLHLLFGERSRQLMDNRADHLQMPQFLRADVRE